MTKQWERQQHETIKAYEAFAIYRDLGVNRSQETVSRKLSKSRQVVSRWSAQNNWVERVAAYDDHLEKIERAAMEKERITQRKRRLKISMAFQSRLVDGLKDLDLENIKALDLANALRIINAEIRKDIGEEEKPQIEINNNVEISQNSTRAELVERLKALRED